MKSIFILTVVAFGISSGAIAQSPKPPKVLVAAWLSSNLRTRCTANDENQRAELAYMKACEDYVDAHPDLPAEMCPHTINFTGCVYDAAKFKCDNSGECHNGYLEVEWQKHNYIMPAAVWQKLAHTRKADVLDGAKRGLRSSEINERIAANRAKIIDDWVTSIKKRRAATEVND